MMPAGNWKDEVQYRGLVTILGLTLSDPFIEGRVGRGRRGRGGRVLQGGGPG